MAHGDCGATVDLLVAIGLDKVETEMERLVVQHALQFEAGSLAVPPSSAFGGALYEPSQALTNVLAGVLQPLCALRWHAVGAYDAPGCTVPMSARAMLRTATEEFFFSVFAAVARVLRTHWRWLAMYGVAAIAVGDPRVAAGDTSFVHRSINPEMIGHVTSPKSAADETSADTSDIHRLRAATRDLHAMQYFGVYHPQLSGREQSLFRGMDSM